MIPCRILVIAPYESMKNILLFICKDRPEVRLTVMVGDLGEGARLVQDEMMSDADTIMEYLQNHLNGKVGEKYANPYGDGRIVIK